MIRPILTFLDDPRDDLNVDAENHPLDADCATDVITEWMSVNTQPIDVVRCAFDPDSKTHVPEEIILGGNASMPFVNEMVSCETAFWRALQANPQYQANTLRVSLVLLRHIFGGLDIVGWEDIDVWTRVLAKLDAAGAKIAYKEQDLATQPTALTMCWKDPIWTLVQFEPCLADLVEETGFELARLASKWKTNFFDVSAGDLDVRSAAAQYTLFLLGRAGLSAQQQGYVAKTLLTRPS